MLSLVSSTNDGFAVGFDWPLTDESILDVPARASVKLGCRMNSYADAPSHAVDVLPLCGERIDNLTGRKLALPADHGGLAAKAFLSLPQRLARFR